MADLRVSELPVLVGTDLAATDLLPVADVSASETRKLTAKELIQSGLHLIDNDILDGAKLVPDSVTAAQIAPNAVTASELADASVDTNALVDLAVTNSKIAAGVDGAKLLDDTVTAAKVPAASLDRGIDKTSGKIGHTNAIAAGSRNGISYDAQGHITAAAALAPTDLPTATAALKGAVIVPAASGLNVSGAGELSHQSSIAAGTTSGITYNATGHITAVARLAPGDLPIATATTDGVVKVPGPGLSVDAAGALAHDVSPVAPGAYPKVTVDSRGHVTAGQMLADADIPNISAAKLTSGTLDAARIGAGTITQQMLADYSLSFIQEATPPTTGVTAGTLWLQESTGQIRMWNGNSWFPIGFGRLSQENLRYCGVFNAATGAITGVTQFGTQEGFKIGDIIPSASDAKSGVYFVCGTPGNGAAVATGIAFDAGDWIICNGATAGWTRIDTLNGGGGGGGGATHLDDLLDVQLTALVAGQSLEFNASGQWVNKTPASASATAEGIIQLATQAEVDAGTDALKSITPATLQNCVLDGGNY